MSNPQPQHHVANPNAPPVEPFCGACGYQSGVAPYTVDPDSREDRYRPGKPAPYYGHKSRKPLCLKHALEDIKARMAEVLVHARELEAKWELNFVRDLLDVYVKQGVEGYQSINALLSNRDENGFLRPRTIFATNAVADFNGRCNLEAAKAILADAANVLESTYAGHARVGEFRGRLAALHRRVETLGDVYYGDVLRKNGEDIRVEAERIHTALRDLEAEDELTQSIEDMVSGWLMDGDVAGASPKELPSVTGVSS